MNEKDKYLKIYKGLYADGGGSGAPHGKMGGGYGRICWGENVLETLKAWKVGSLLDVGCGYGNFCDAATLFVPEVYGLDIASVATGNVVDNPEITFYDGEAKCLPLPDNGVEWVTAFDCLEHCPEADIDTILSEFNRVAAKGFVLSISHVPCECAGMPLHLTVRPEDWWMDRLRRFGAVSKVGRTPITNAPYLVCRKPAEKKLICYCAGGLGRRLRSLAAGAQMARRTDRRLVMLWRLDDPLCQADFHDLFSNSIDRIDEAALPDLSSCKVYALVKDVAAQSLVSGGSGLRTAVRRWGSFDPHDIAKNDPEDHLILFHPDSPGAMNSEAGQRFITGLRPSAPLQDRIDSAASDLALDRKIMGVHARGTDFGVTVDAYADMITRALAGNPRQRFLVCSEDRTFEQQLQHQFPHNVQLRPKTDWHRKTDPSLSWATGNLSTSAASVMETLIDIHLLARTQFVIYHASSALAAMGVVLNRSPQSVASDSAAKPPEATHRPAGPATPVAAGRSERAPAGVRPDHRIYYFCPQPQSQSAGIRRLLRHVAYLNAAGFEARILHESSDLQHADMPEAPLAHLDDIEADPGAVFVIPEGMPRIMHTLKHHPGRRLAIALSWHYIFSTLPAGTDWRHFNIEAVLAVSPVVGELAAWSMGLPVHQLRSGIDGRLYYHDPALKEPRIAFIARKAHNLAKLKGLLGSRNKDYISKIKWVSLEGLNEESYAAEIRRAAVFLSTSPAEGFPTSCLEAMAAGALVAGHDSVGGRGMLSGRGAEQNCLLSPNGDYLSLAYALSPVLDDLLSGRMHRWQAIVGNAKRLAAQHRPEAEKRSVIEFWHNYLNRPPKSQPAPEPSIRRTTAGGRTAPSRMAG